MEDSERRDQKWQQRLSEQSKQIARALLENQPAEPDRYSRPLRMTTTMQRWISLETKRVDHGTGRPGPGHEPITAWVYGARCKLVEPIFYGWAERTYLEEHGFSCDGEPARKRRETALSDNALDRGDSDDSGSRPGWLARVIHPRWRQHAAAGPDPREHLFQRARARRIYGEFRTATRAVRAFFAEWAAAPRHPGATRLTAPTDDRGPKFDPSALSDDARARWAFERMLDQIADRADRYNESVKANYGATDEFGRYDGAHQGWAPRIGVKRADKLLAIATARRHAEAMVEAHAFRRTPIERAFDRLCSKISRVNGIDRRLAPDEYLATLPQRIATEFARREPAAYAWLAEADEDGATEIPARVMKAIGRCPLVDCVPRALAAHLTAALKGQAGDGQNIINTLAKRAFGFQAARRRHRELRKVRRNPATYLCWPITL